MRHFRGISHFVLCPFLCFHTICTDEMREMLQCGENFLQAAGSPHIHIISPVIDTGRNLPEHPKQIKLMQSRPQAFVRMCLKAALTAKRLICKKTLAGCDRAVCQPVYPEDTFGGCFRVRFLQFLGFCRKRTRSEGQIVSCSELEIF